MKPCETVTGKVIPWASVLLGPLLMLGCHHTPAKTADKFFIKCESVGFDVKTKTQMYVCKATDGHSYKVTITP